MESLKQLAQAGREAAVLAIVSGYLAAMPRGLRESLSLPAQVGSAAEVLAWHTRLADVLNDHGHVEGLHEVAVLFVRAAARLVELGVRLPPRNDAQDRRRGNGGTR